MRPHRVLALAALAVALCVAPGSAHADVFHYDVTIAVPDGSTNWNPGTETGSISSSWTATWRNVGFATTPVQSLARIEPATYLKAPISPTATPVNNGISGSWHGTNGATWSCELPAGFDFASFGPLGLVLSGGGLDEDVTSRSTSYAQTGKFGLAVAFQNVQKLVLGACNGIEADPYERLSPYIWVGLETCFADATRRGETLGIPVDQLGQSQISFQARAAVGPGWPGAVCWDRAYGDGFSVTGTYNVTMTRTDTPLASYGGKLGVSPGVLDELEDFEFRRMRNYQRDLLKIAGLLEVDLKRHPARARRDRRALEIIRRSYIRVAKDFRRSLDQGNFQHPPIGLEPGSDATTAGAKAHASIGDKERETLNQAMSYGLEDGAKSLKEYLADQKVADGKAAVLVTHLTDLERLLNGRVDPTSKEGDALMKSELTGLVSTFGKLDKGSRLPTAAGNIYELLRADKNKVAEVLDKQVQTEVKAYAKKIAGKDGEELAKQLFTLRDVLSGKYVDDQDKQFDVLKDSVAALASRIAGEDVLKLPQVRAAMFGFKLGKAFGDRIAADLKLVASTVLVRECKQVIAKAQGVTPAEIDYSQDTNRRITAELLPGTTYADWICKTHPESVAEGVSGGVIEAISPVNKLFGTKIPLSDRLGIHLTGGKSVFFDTAYSNVPG
jgi:hypothetical protein